MIIKKNIISFLAFFLFAGFSAFSQVDDPCDDSPNAYSNLTPNSLATQSSTDGGNLASFAIDGNTGGTSLAMTQDEGNAWLDIQLSSPSYVDEMTIWFPAGQPLGSAYALFSNTPFQSENLAQELANEENEYLYLQGVQSGATFPVNMTGVQYIRIQNENGGVLSLFEVVIPGVTEDCGNGIDDDCDGLVDCDDPDCGPRISNVDLSNGPSCPACSDGSIFIQASGANSEYFLYSIDGGQTFHTTNTFEGLPVGTYDIVVKNYWTGCTSTSDGGYLPPLLLGIPNGCCDNGDFESGTFDNWTGDVGRVNDGKVKFDLNLGIVSGRHSIISVNSGYEDPYMPGLPALGTTSSDFVARLGSGQSGESRAHKLTYNFTVEECNTDFRFNYLLVGADPDDLGDHGVNKNPYFEYTLTHIATGDEINKRTIRVNVDGTDPAFTIGKKIGGVNIVHTNWECVNIDLSEYVGEEVSIEFIVADCTDNGAHTGYVYIDGLCDQIEDVTPVVDMILPEAFCQNQPQFIIDATGSTGYSVHGWTICELDGQGEEINCVTYDELGKGIVGLFDAKTYYENGSGQFECGKTYKVKLTLDNDCTGEVSDSIEFSYVCEDIPALNYMDILNCGEDDVDVMIEGEDLCPECDYVWTPGIIYLSDENAQFPIIEGSRNIDAFNTDYQVVATNEFGCTESDEVLVINFDEFSIELEAIPETYCEYELFATISTSTNGIVPTGFITSVEFTNLDSNETFAGTLVEANINYWKYKLEGFSVPRNVGTEDDWKAEASIGEGLFTLAGNCFFEDVIFGIEPNDLYFGPVNFIMPNVFTPNGDTINDLFGPITCIPIELQEERQLNAYYGKIRIWDRWGNLVFEKEAHGGPFEPFNPEELYWDGNYNGDPAASDVYIYDIELKNCDSPDGDESNCNIYCHGDGNNNIPRYTHTCPDHNTDNNGFCQFTDDNNEVWPGRCECCEWSGDVTLIR